jgi:hypothetical protein
MKPRATPPANLRFRFRSTEALVMLEIDTTSGSHEPPQLPCAVSQDADVGSQGGSLRTTGLGRLIVRPGAIGEP